MSKIKSKKINRLLEKLGFPNGVDKPMTEFSLKIYLKNLGLNQEEIRESISGFQ